MQYLIPLGALVLGLILGWLMNYQSQKALNRSLIRLELENQELWNRIVSGDLPTYQQMTMMTTYRQSLTASDEDNLHSDEAEADLLARQYGEGALDTGEDFDLSDLVGGEFTNDQRR